MPKKDNLTKQEMRNELREFVISTLESGNRISKRIDAKYIDFLALFVPFCDLAKRGAAVGNQTSETFKLFVAILQRISDIFNEPDGSFERDFLILNENKKKLGAFGEGQLKKYKID